MKMSANELHSALIADLLADAEHAEKQAETGPFFPAFRAQPWTKERPAITAESLRAYAAECRKEAAALELRHRANSECEWCGQAFKPRHRNERVCCDDCHYAMHDMAQTKES